MRPDDYEPVRMIADLGRRIGEAAGRSTNIELRAREVRAGGNGPLMAGALAALGVRVTLIGALGRGDDRGVLDPAYGEIAGLCERVVSIAPSARTDALEFDDGKVMFNWSAGLDGVDWSLLTSIVPVDELAELCARSSVLATINWTNVGGLGSIWRGLRERVLPRLGDRAPSLFVDLSDPAKRGDEDLLGMLEDLRLFPENVGVTLGLNVAEASRLGRLLGLGVDIVGRTAVGDFAERIRVAACLERVVIHTRGTVAAADRDGVVVLTTRRVDRPVISTGAGDHFNGGYAAGRAFCLPVAESLACGCDTASLFVRTGRRPLRDELIGELRAPFVAG